MSRIGKKPVSVPAGVEVTINADQVVTKGPKGELSFAFEPQYVTLSLTDGEVVVERANDTKEARSRHGLYRSLMANAIEGVVNGFSKTLEIKGVGYKAALKGEILEMNLGFSHPINYKLPQGVEVVFKEKSNTVFTISGIDKQTVGQTAAEIRSYRKPEPYKGKGVRYIDEHVVQKSGKSAKK